jgi:hypothetical protein
VPGGGQAGTDNAGHGHSRYGPAAASVSGSGYGWPADDPSAPRARNDSSRNDGGGSGRAGDDAAGYHQAGYDEAGYGGPSWPDDDLGSPYSWSTGDPDAWPATSLSGRDAVAQLPSNAVRGFPPAPGDSLPAYPPGPFAAWNRGQPGRPDGRPAGRAGGLADGSQLAVATITPDEFDTDYSLPAIKDPLPGKAGRAAADSTGRAAAAGTAEKVSGDQAARSAGPRARGGRAKGQGGRGRKKRQPAWLAIGAAAVIIAAVAAILVTTLPHAINTPPPVKPSSTPTPLSSSPAPPAGPWGYIGSRKTDPVPLTAAELYPASVSSQGSLYSRAKQVKGKNCRAAIIGGALRAAVRLGACTQTLRATYLSKTAKVMGTIGVFNLKNFAAASKAAGKAGHAEFVAQLAAKRGPAKAIGQGTGLEEAIVKGHYLVLVWAETTNLTPPKGQAGRAHLTAFMNLLVKHTVNVSLSNRMVDGKPAPAG